MMPQIHQRNKIDLNDYAGNYDYYAWRGEHLILPWKGKLADIHFAFRRSCQ